MRLRPRFTLWFSFAALLPIAAAALIAREVVSQNYTDSFARTRAATERTLRRERERLESAVTGAVRGMDKRHPLVGGLFLELRKHGQRLPPEVRRHIKEQAQQYMRGLGLDLLLIVDTDDRVVAAPHYRPARDTVDAARAVRAQRLDARAYYAYESFVDGSGVVSKLVVAATGQYQEARHRITIVAGRIIDDDMLHAVYQPMRIHGYMKDVEGRVLFAATDVATTSTAAGNAAHEDVRPHKADSETDSEAGSETDNSADHGLEVALAIANADTIHMPLRGPDGEVVATVDVAVSRAELEESLAQVTTSALFLALAALLGTVLLAMVVARRMTRDLDQLVTGAQAAARGQWDHRVVERTGDEIGAVAHSFNLMMEDLTSARERLVMAERVAAWQEIARRLAHELKNPLTPIQMAVETLRKAWKKQHPSFGELFDESTVTVLEESARLKRIIGEFSQFARLPKPSLGPCDLGELIANCLSLYGRRGPESTNRSVTDSRSDSGGHGAGGDIAFDQRIAALLPAVHADRDQLSQVLLNLLENARQALGEHGRGGANQSAENAESGVGRIIVSAQRSRRPDFVELIVEDNGPGIAEAVKQKLFTPYFTTKQDSGGTGLGLAIVHRIVSDHGGWIQVGDSDSGGARFIIELPIHPDTAVTNAPLS